MKKYDYMLRFNAL